MRRGISLMEVLISIGIMAIGMLSIASLLPVGNIQVHRATTEERKAELGLNACDEFIIRGWNDNNHSSTLWVRANGSPFYTDNSATIANGFIPYTELPVAIDPMMVASKGAAADTFPLNVVSGAPSLKRITISSVNSRPLAEAACMMQSELVVDQPDDRTLPSTGHMMLDTSSAAIKRDYEGGYSWMALLLPTGTAQPGQTVTGGPSPPGTEVRQTYYPSNVDRCSLTIVIFKARNVQTPSEEMVSVTQPASPTVNIDGGDMTFTGTDAKLALAKPGEWLMLCRADGASNICKWYRIVNVDSDTSGQASVTLTGPDWTWGSGSQLTYACLFDGVVAVFERPIKMGQSAY